MNIKKFTLLIVLAFCLCLSACGEVKRPIDCPDTTWECEAQNIKFSVSENCEIKDATVIDKNGNTISISFVFSEMSEGKVSITSPDGIETYLAGTCTYDKDSFDMTITDIYNSDLDHLPLILKFKR